MIRLRATDNPKEAIRAAANELAAPAVVRVNQWPANAQSRQSLATIIEPKPTNGMIHGTDQSKQKSTSLVEPTVHPTVSARPARILDREANRAPDPSRDLHIQAKARIPLDRVHIRIVPIRLFRKKEPEHRRQQVSHKK